MNKKLYLKISLIIITFLFISCFKNFPDNNTPKPKKLLSGRVIEEGSNSPIIGAKVSAGVCTQFDFFGCARWDDTVVYSDSFGKFRFYKDVSRNISIEFSGYWSHIDEPDVTSVFGSLNYQPAHVDYYTDQTGSLDSFLIHLFPVKNITVNVKNTGVGSSSSLRCKALFFGTNASKINLRSGIDTSFQYPVFGNTENKVFVVRDSPLNDTVYAQTRYINKTESLILDIIY